MIKKIQSVKNFGVYKNFTWRDTPNFNEKNIFYGWNYSGKTTLSRIFSSLKNKELHPHFQEGEFKIVLSDDSILTHENVATSDLNVIVFNSEYIRENLKWDIDTSINGITFDVGENIAVREEIENNLAKINSINGNETYKGRKGPYLKIVTDFLEYGEKKFSAEAKSIKNNSFNSLIEFDKRHFEKIKDEIIQDLTAYIIPPTELNSVKKIALASDDKDLINKIEYEFIFDELYRETEFILKSEPNANNLIPFLDENHKHSQWVNEGLKLHEGKSECTFCQGKINLERINALKAYFSNESCTLKTNINSVNHKIDDLIIELNSMPLPQSKNDFFDSFQNDYETLKEEFLNNIERLNIYINKITAQLTNKELNNLFISQQISPLENDLILNFNYSIKSINELISKHNGFVENFDDEQSKAREKLKRHLVANYLIEEDYLDKEKEKKYALRYATRYEDLVKKLKKRNQFLESQLKSIAAGREQLNAFIQKFLARDDIQIEVTEDDKFILKRGEKIAENLSEGEKTAISFSYFLVVLESLYRDGKIFDYIIFIDDPISSLDGNHISQIYTLINSFFFRQNINPQNPNQIVNLFKQLFISTHNSDFFAFLKDSNRINKRRKPDNTSTSEYYLIKKINNEESMIVSMPKSLKNHKSEYLYLFELIYGFHNSPNKEADEKLVLLPNAVRRFLEIYTLLKLPSSTEEVDVRLKELHPDYSELKTLHHFSHFTNIDKVTRHDGLIMNLPNAVNELMTMLEKDESHFNSLKKGVTLN